MASSENRIWTRLSPAESEMQLKTKQGVIRAKVVDVSFGGLAAEVKENLELADGDEIDVCWRGNWMRGIVRNLDQFENGYRLGVEWAKNAVATS